MSEEQEAAVCMPVAFGPARVLSEIRQCVKCGQDVWAAASMVRLLALKPSIKVLCVPCAITAPDIDFDTQSLDVPGQREEVEAAGLDYDSVKRGLDARFNALRERRKQAN